MKSISLLLVALLAAPLQGFAADAVKIDVYAGGNLRHSVALTGAKPSVTISHSAVPNTTLQLNLIAPEPLIIEVKEETEGNGGVVASEGRVKLLTPGSSFAVSDIKGGNFHSPYVLVRPE